MNEGESSERLTKQGRKRVQREAKKKKRSESSLFGLWLIFFIIITIVFLPNGVVTGRDIAGAVSLGFVLALIPAVIIRLIFFLIRQFFNVFD